jgi:hypothetical protein
VRMAALENGAAWNLLACECMGALHHYFAVLALALGLDSSAAVLRPAGAPFMPLRCPHQAPGLRMGMVGSTTVDRPAHVQDKAIARHCNG